MPFFSFFSSSSSSSSLSRKRVLISAYDGYVSRSETPTRPHSAPSTPIVRLIYVFSRVIRPLHLWPTLVEGGRSPWRRGAFRRPIVGRLRRRRQPCEPVRNAIIIDGERRERGWWEARPTELAVFLPFFARATGAS